MHTILVVDDEAVDREDVSRSLRDVQDLQIIEVSNGEAALALIASSPPDMVLTDLRMPGMNGLELVEKLQEAHPQLPVVLMTSRGSERIAVQALQAGASSYVPKANLTVDLPDTVWKVLQIAESRQMRRALLGHLVRSEVEFALGNDHRLAFPLAAYFEDNLERMGFGDVSMRNKVGMALVEVVTNAIIHGNLEVDSSIRKEGNRAYFDAIERRQAEEPYASRRVHVTASESTRNIEFRITDEGPGFDVVTLPDPTEPENLLKISGRGVMLMRTFMDEVRFSPKGNEVTMTKRLEPVAV